MQQPMMMQPFGQQPIIINQQQPMGQPLGPQQPQPEPPLKKTDDEFKRYASLTSAAFKVWQVYVVIRFMALKEELTKAVLAAKQNFSQTYFREDLPAIKEQGFLMLKARFEALIADVDLPHQVVEDTEAGPFAQNSQKLNATLELVLDELIDLVTIKEKATFDNPFVLSFLANTCFEGSFVPEGYYTPFEFGRLRFTATGQLANGKPATQELVAGGLLLCRGLCRELFANAQTYFPQLQASPHGFGNLELVAAVLYQAFVDKVEPLEFEADNTAGVSLNDEPACLERGIDWREGQPANGDGILLGAPSVDGLDFDRAMVAEKMDVFLANLVRFVKMQGENERLPLHKKKLEVINAVAAKAKRADAELHQTLFDLVRQKERELKLAN